MKGIAEKVVDIRKAKSRDKVEVSGFEFSISKLKKINTEEDRDECLVWGCSNSRPEGNLVCRQCYNLPGTGRLLIEALRKAAEKVGVKMAEKKERWLNKEEWQDLIEAAVRKREELNGSSDHKIAEELGNDFPSYSYKLLLSAVRAGATRTNNDTFREIVDAGQGWLGENPRASKENLIRQYLLLFQDQEKVVLVKAAALVFRTFHHHRKEWQEAIEAARIWLDENPGSFKRNPVEIADKIMDELKPYTSYSKLIKAVSDVIQENREKIWNRCELVAEEHFSINSRDTRHPGEIAEELLVKHHDLPKSMLTAALGQVQKPILANERRRLIALANNRLVKKPGSATRRGQGRGPKGEGEGGAKKRGAKC